MCLEYPQSKEKHPSKYAHLPTLWQIGFYNTYCFNMIEAIVWSSISLKIAQVYRFYRQLL